MELELPLVERLVVRADRMKENIERGLEAAERSLESRPEVANVLPVLVDDDRLVLATVTHGLTQAGYEVIDADNGDDAILLAREHKPDLALLDIRMEGKSGFDVAEYLRDVCHVPFIFLSAFADADTVAQVAALGAVAYMVKPLDVGQIVPTVDAAFERLRPKVEAIDSVPSLQVECIWKSPR